MTIPEHERARQWREARGLTQQQLADLTGYSQSALSWFERGLTPPDRLAKSGNAKDRSIDPFVWQRFRLICSGVDRQLRSGKEFDW